MGIRFGREFVVDARGQEEDDVVFSDRPFEQIDGVVALEPDEEVRVDDIDR